MGSPPGENTITSCLVNNTVQSTFHMGLTPTRVLVKEGMMYPVFGNCDTNCGIGSVALDDDLSNFPISGTALIYEALVLGGPCGSDGAMYR